MWISALGISEDCIREPNESNHITVQSQYFHSAVVSETAICPCLGKNDVNLVLLWENKDQTCKKKSSTTVCFSNFKKETSISWTHLIIMKIIFVYIIPHTVLNFYTVKIHYFTELLCNFFTVFLQFKKTAILLFSFTFLHWF